MAVHGLIFKKVLKNTPKSCFYSNVFLILLLYSRF